MATTTVQSKYFSQAGSFSLKAPVDGSMIGCDCWTIPNCPRQRKTETVPREGPKDGNFQLPPKSIPAAVSCVDVRLQN